MSKLPIQSMQDLMAAGGALARSGFFGSINPDAGFYIACDCWERDMSYQEWARTYNIVKGKVSMKADAMLAAFNDGGGSHKVIQRDADKATVEMSIDGQTQTFSLTWETAQGEAMVYDKCYTAADLKRVLAMPFDQRPLKAKYASPRSRGQMLWARVTSDAVRAMYPSVNNGMYTPEEVDDFTKEPKQAPATVNAGPYDVTGQHVTIPPPQAPLPQPTPAQAGQAVVDAMVTPFDKGPDFSLCPIESNLFGKPWSGMDDALLNQALTLPELSKQMQPGHIAAVKAEIAKRTGGGDNG